MRRLRMNKIKTCIDSDSHKKYTFSKLRDTILRKIIKMRFYNISWGDTFKVLNNGINGLSAICCQQTFYIFRHKSFWFFSINKFCKMAK